MVENFALKLRVERLANGDIRIPAQKISAEETTLLFIVPDEKENELSLPQCVSDICIDSTNTDELFLVSIQRMI